MTSRSFLCLLSAACIVAAAAACSSSESSSPSSDTGARDGTPSPVVNPGDETKEEKDPASEVVVALDAEDFRSQGFQINVVEIVAKVDGIVAARETLSVEKTVLFPHELHLQAPKSKPDAAVDVEIVVRDRPDNGNGTPPILTRLVHTRFVKGKKVLAYVLLEVRCNSFSLLGGGVQQGPTCAAPATCIGGACRSADLGELPDFRPDWATNPPSACGSGAPELTLAKGELAASPLADGDTLVLEQGGQCGHHVWLSAKMKNLGQAGTKTVVTASQPGSALTVPATGFPYSFSPSGDGSCELTGIRFQLDIAGTKASEFAGKPLDITIESTDKAGKKASSTRHVNIAPDIKVIPGRNCGP